MTIYGGLEFVDIGYKPKSTDVLVEYYAKPKKGMKLAKLCEYIAGESSIGTWTKIKTMNPTIAKKLKPHVYYVNDKKGIIRIAYPEELFEAGNMPGIMSSIAGNVFGMKEAVNLRFQDARFTKSILKKFRGPQFGIKGIRKMTKVRKRPLVGTIVKPKVGLTSQQHAKVAYDSWAGGLDLVKDDENLTSMSFNKFDTRARLTLKARDKAEKETGEKKLYLANISAPYNEMIRRANLVKELGGEYVMVDVLTCGWSALHGIRDWCHDNKKAIHAHRAMHGALTRDPHQGISMLMLAKTYRMIGVDTLHIGTAGIGKMHGSADEELLIERQVEDRRADEHLRKNVLGQPWHHLKPVFAVASGGLCPVHIPKLIRTMGNDIVIQGGGGVHGNPGGTRLGAEGMRQAVEAVMDNQTLKERAKKSKGLALALEKWG